MEFKNSLGCSGCACIVLVGAVTVSAKMPMGAAAIHIKVHMDAVAAGARMPVGVVVMSVRIPLVVQWHEVQECRKVQ